MKTFGTLEYAIDKYSGSWTWKITGVRAVMMVSKLIPELWYGNGPNEVIIPDTEKNVKQIRLILERYPLEILSKSVWQRKARVKTIKKSPNTIRFIRNTVTLYEMRKIPRPFKMPWGKGMVIDEVSISSQYHEPTIQLLEFDNGDKLLRFCSYSHGRFSRSPLMIDEKDLRLLGKAIVKGKEIRKFVSKLNQ